MMKELTVRCFRGCRCVILLLGAWILQAGSAGAVETAWIEGFNSKTRMTAGMVEGAGAPRLYAFVEVVMPKGWKTYWRNPGDAGGLPPTFSWVRSQNVAAADVLYPAPHRLTDAAGDNIGYKEQAIFPVALKAKDATKPIRLTLDMEFGICKDICVPSEAAIELEIPPGAAAGHASAEAVGALALVPRKAGDRLPADPELVSVRLDQSDKPKIIVSARFPGGAEGGDVFLEAPDGLYIPMLSRTTTDNGEAQVFEAELGPGLEAKEIQGKSLAVTLVSARGQIETSVSLE